MIFNNIRSVSEVISAGQESQLLMPKQSCQQVILDMGFSLDQIQCLFINHPEIENVDQALQLMEKTDLGYPHKYYDKINGICGICE